MPANIKKVLLGVRYRGKIGAELEKLGLCPIYLPDNPDVDTRLAGHTDLSVLKTGNDLLLAPYLRGSDISYEMTAAGYNVSYADIRQTPVYPYDAQLNLCVSGNYFIYNPKTAYRPIVEILTKRHGLKPISVKQGYARCSVCMLPDGSAITGDRGIYAAVNDADIECLLINEGYILLSGYDYGFIGGASFIVDEHRIALTGLLDDHPDKDRIRAFLHMHDTEAVFLTGEPAFDMGSAIIL